MEFGKVMTHVRNPDTRAGRLLYGGVAGSVVVALATGGCGSDPNKGLTDPAPTPRGNPPEHVGGQEGGHANPNDDHDHPQLVFDDLGGGSPYILVYPGPNADPDSDNGVYPDGEAVDALCVTEGRTVQSDPSLGEERRESDDWIEIDGTPGERQFATAVYAHNPNQLVLQLPECD
ncbi:MAG TPA: hypothetical protein VD706_00555 [Candidatus Saccharimonadales bacterium]|nr:hypothetical protein [Candidatus Saccharimonadales bacterium]